MKEFPCRFGRTGSSGDSRDERGHVLDVIPVDGIIARGDYEHEFTLHQFTILPGGAASKFKITQFDKIKGINGFRAVIGDIVP